MEPGIHTCPGFSWLENSGKPRIVSLFGPNPVILPGRTVPTCSIPPLQLSFITSDKDLYYQGKEPVRLFVYEPFSPGREETIILSRTKRFAAEIIREITVRLDDTGAAELKLYELPAGEYAASWKEDPYLANPWSFIVAEYSLAPMTATLEKHWINQEDRIEFSLHLETFGVPVEGQVQLAIIAGGERLFEGTVRARKGKVRASFDRTRNWGAYSVNVHLVNDPSKTASVALPGSSYEGWEETVFSPLGKTVSGSLISRENTRPVRGIYLREAEKPAGDLFELERIDTRKARLISRTDAEEVLAVVVDPFWPQMTSIPFTQTMLQTESVDLARTFLAQGEPSRARQVLETSFYRTWNRANPHAELIMTECEVVLGNKHAAVWHLRQAIRAGAQHLPEFERICTLEGLRDFPLLKRLLAAQPREIPIGPVTGGQVIEVDVPSPAGLLAIGAFVHGKPWEGWAVTVAPSGFTPEITLPESLKPGTTSTIEISAPSAQKARVVVKDVRLTTKETPENLLASKIKAFASASCLKNQIVPSHRLAQNLDFSVKPGQMEKLLERNILTPEQLFEAFSKAHQLKQPIRQVLITHNYVTRETLNKSGICSHSEQDLFNLDPKIVRSIPDYLAKRYKVLPVSLEGTTLTLAMADPMNFLAIDDIRIITGYEVQPVVAPEETILKALENYFGTNDLPEVDETVKDIADSDFTGPEADMNQLKSEGQKALATRTAEDYHEILFSGIVPLEDGKARIDIPLNETKAEYRVDVLAMGMLDWAQASASFKAEAPLSVFIEAPPFIHPEDRVTGQVRFCTAAPPVKLTLTRDGSPVELHLDGKPVPYGELLAGNEETLTFAALPGVYEAILEEPATGATARHHTESRIPGKISSLCSTIQWLKTGDTLDSSADPEILRMRVIPGFHDSLKTLAHVTAGYEHCCCEQTAAKILAGTALYHLVSGKDGSSEITGNLPAGTEALRKKAEDVILAGIERIRKMVLQDGSFSMYPQHLESCSPFLGITTAHHFSSLQLFRSQPGLKPEIAAAMDVGIAMAEAAYKAYNYPWPPETISSAQEAYLAVQSGRATTEEALALARNIHRGSIPETDGCLGYSVRNRLSNAYAAAILLRAGNEDDRNLAVSLVNRVLRSQRSGGGYYSTADSIAVLWLLHEMADKELYSGKGTVLLDGKRMSSSEAVSHGADVQNVQVLEGPLLVEITRSSIEDWKTLPSTVPVKAAIEASRDNRPVRAGDSLNLTVSLPGGYLPGDIVHVCLPQALSQIEGGGQVKQFTVDMAGRNTAEIPLAATGTTTGTDGEIYPQHVTVLVRNMYDEDRAGFPEELKITVLPPAPAETPNEPALSEETADILKLPASDLVNLANETPIIRIINLILTRAFNNGITRVVFESGEIKAKVLFEKDGALEETLEPPQSVFIPMIARLHLMAEIPPGTFFERVEGTIDCTCDDESFNVLVITAPDGGSIRAEVFIQPGKPAAD